MKRIKDMALGATILMVGIVMGQLLNPAVAIRTSEVVDKLVCREIQIVDEKGQLMTFLGADQQGGQLMMYDSQRKPLIHMSAANRGGSLLVWGKDGDQRISLNTDEKGGAVTIWTPDNKIGAVMSTLDDLSRLHIGGQSGKVVISADETESSIDLIDYEPLGPDQGVLAELLRPEITRISMRSENQEGLIVVRGPDPARVIMGLTDNDGTLVLVDKNGEIRSLK